MSKILIVEDDNLVAATISIVLGKAGHRVVLARDGRAGIDSALADPPDLVITDMIMPNEKGIEVVRRLRAVYPGLPIVAISGSSDAEIHDLLQSAKRAGATAVLRKPFSNIDFMRIVDRCLNSGTEPSSGTGSKG